MKGVDLIAVSMIIIGMVSVIYLVSVLLDPPTVNGDKRACTNSGGLVFNGRYEWICLRPDALQELKR